MWRNILASKEAISYGCRRKIGDGRDTNVRHSPWLPCEDNGFLTSLRYSELEDATFHGLISDTQNAWDMEIINEICNDRDKQLIQQIPISSVPRRDS